MKSPVLALLVSFCLAASTGGAELSKVNTVVHAQPLHSGRIDPKLFGNFVELLDDVVPGMWAELLNDRSFVGIVPPAHWWYYDGSLDICDRTWDANASWTWDDEHPFNGSRTVR